MIRNSAQKHHRDFMYLIYHNLFFFSFFPYFRLNIIVAFMIKYDEKWLNCVHSAYQQNRKSYTLSEPRSHCGIVFARIYLCRLDSAIVWGQMAGINRYGASKRAAPRQNSMTKLDVQAADRNDRSVFFFSFLFFFLLSFNSFGFCARIFVFPLFHSLILFYFPI